MKTTRVLDLEQAQQLGVFTPLDLQFARYLGQLAGEQRPEALLVAALVSRRTREGHVCVDLERFAGTRVSDARQELVDGLLWPKLDALLGAVADCPLVGAPETNTPLVSAGKRLYLRRYFEHEAVLSSAVRQRLRRSEEELFAGGPADIFARLLPPAPGSEVDWQRFAVQLALLSPFCIISGGPGTGKTSTVVRLLALLVELALARDRPPPKVRLLAPTGKATLRLMESLRSARDRLECSDAVRAALPVEASTIHRALVPRGDGRPGFEHGPERPLSADVVLVDECSMVDVALMRRLIEAVPQHAKLILLGDRHQLSSVEAGAVMADLCGTDPHPGYSKGLEQRFRSAFSEPPPTPARDRTPPIADAIVELKKSYRFGGDSGIAALARAIKSGDADRVLERLTSGGPDLRWIAVGEGARGPKGPLEAAVLEGYAALCASAQPDQALAALGRFRVLCAHRRGPLGVEGMNRLAERTLSEASRLRATGTFYSHRPLLVRSNDYGLGLFNGDAGVVLPGRARGGELCAHFIQADGRVRQLPLSRLPAHETAFAMSIHMSQGSEFDDVAVVLPDASSPLLSRELLYTAVTRARRHVLVYGSAESLRAAVERRVERASGLSEALWS